MNVKKQIKSALTMLGILSLSFGFSLFLKDAIMLEEHITTVFVFAVFLISILTDGYVWGIVAAVIGVLAVNFAFVFPYFSFVVALPENVFSALIMIVISLITSTLTTKLKKSKSLRIEGEREKMKANLLRAVSHDIRTPLTTIYGASSVMLESYDDLSDEQKISMIRGIREDSDWLNRMVENLLSITRTSGGNVKLIKTPTVLEELIDSVILKFKKRYPESAVEIDIPQDVIIIPMDAILVEQVIINLLENAVRHARGMTRLSLGVSTDENVAIFKISDDGCGISPERMGKIFDGDFVSDTSAEDSNRKNAGIGLSVCASIIKAHGGTIEAENLPSGGAEFTFCLLIKEEIS